MIPTRIRVVPPIVRYTPFVFIYYKCAEDVSLTLCILKTRLLLFIFHYPISVIAKTTTNTSMHCVALTLFFRQISVSLSLEKKTLD